MMKYSPKEVQTVVQMASENPRGFLHLTQKYAPHLLESTKQSFKAWGINIHKGTHGNHSSHRLARSRENYSN